LVPLNIGWYRLREGIFSAEDELKGDKPAEVPVFAKCDQRAGEKREQAPALHKRVSHGCRFLPVFAGLARNKFKVPSLKFKAGNAQSRSVKASKANFRRNQVILCHFVSSARQLRVGLAKLA